jgi:hypothetical protein
MTQDSQDALDEAQQQYQRAGLPLPPIPAQFVDQLKTIAPWVYGTRPDQSELYYIDVFVDEAMAGNVEDYVQFGHSGRGTNSWAIHYYLVSGSLALFVQVGWGGALTEPEDNARATIKLKRLMAESEQLQQAVEQATARGKLSAGQRLVVIVSTFYGSQWLMKDWSSPENAPPIQPWHESNDDKILPEVIQVLST